MCVASYAQAAVSAAVSGPPVADDTGTKTWVEIDEQVQGCRSEAPSLLNIAYKCRMSEGDMCRVEDSCDQGLAALASLQQDGAHKEAASDTQGA